jgi:P-type Cu2+ transporter
MQNHTTMDHKVCSCGKSCMCCQADNLSVTCGCSFEAKQYEYNLNKKLSHEHHEKMNHKDHDMPAMSHADHEAAMSDPKMAAWMEQDMRRRFLISLLLVIPLLILSHWPQLVAGIIPAAWINWILLLLATPIVFWTGSIFITGTYYSLKAKKLNMSVLIATGILVSYFASILIMIIGGNETYFEAAGMLVTFVLFGHWMEMRSRRGTSDALSALFKLVPAQATIMKDGKEIIIKAADLKINDIVVIKPGEKIPIDGVIISGTTSIDESLITGESIPVIKKIGDNVIGGSINQLGSVQFKVTHAQSETMLAQIIKLVETAQNSKAPGQRIADKAAAYLVIIAIGSGIITFAIWYFGAQAPFLMALSFAISAVVIACPDALGLATPTAVAVGTGIGAKNNILIKNATTLEQASKIQIIALDKTGTLTEGKPKVYDIITVPGVSKQELLYLAGSAQKFSNHPFAKAILEKTQELKIDLSSNIKNFEAIAGLGIKAEVDDKKVLAGSSDLFSSLAIDTDVIKTEIEQILQQGKSLSIIAVDGKVIGAFSAADKIRDTAKETIDQLKQMGIEPVMITGDTNTIAQKVADQLCIKRFFARVMPAEKRNYVKKLQDEGKFVAMVGDGINDAAALAQADIGIAIGAGTDVALETASIILMKSDPADIIKAIKLSKATVRKMKQNLFWASIYNLLAIPLAAGLFYPSLGWSLRPEISALLMSLSSIIVALNAVSLRFTRL